jgi:pimeloyl-ACP methyl ester carboxylesterase
VPGCQLEHVLWLTPEKDELLEAYAKRMAQQVKEPHPVLMGLSFGGMMCIEIAKLLDAEKVILISSIPSVKQMPLWMRAAGKLKLNKIIPVHAYTRVLEPVQNYHMGVKTREEIEIVRHYRKQVSQVYLDWAVNAVLNWKNTWRPSKLYHIHGDADRIFPLKKVTPDYVVKGGTHFMIFSQAKEVNDCLLLIAG